MCCPIRSRRSPRPRYGRSRRTTGRSSSKRSEQSMNSEIASRVDCGPEGCTLDWLVSERHEIDDDPVEFLKLATDAGWGDGLPLIPPTEARVREFVAASGHFPDGVSADVPPRAGRASV